MLITKKTEKPKKKKQKKTFVHIADELYLFIYYTFWLICAYLFIYLFNYTFLLIGAKCNYAEYVCNLNVLKSNV